MLLKMYPIHKFIAIFCTVFFLFSSCDDSKQVLQPDTEEETVEKIETPNFNNQLAYDFIKKQVDFGPRVPSTSTHEACAQWLLTTLKSSSDSAFFQNFETTTFDGKKHKGKNIIAQINPSNPHRIMFSAHWDTRPFADQDSKDQKKPIMGANDGGSGVGVLLALLDAMKSQKPTIGIDIVLFDIEDYGQPENSGFPEMKDSYCLGSQYWAQNVHTAHAIRYGVLLDMVGGFGATFLKEGYSMAYAPNLVQRVWNHASDLGYSGYFPYKDGPAITDDHTYVNSIARIPTIDIIHLQENQNSSFASYWHTHNDNMASVDKNALKAVGQTLLRLIYEENKSVK